MFWLIVSIIALVLELLSGTFYLLMLSVVSLLTALFGWMLSLDFETEVLMCSLFTAVSVLLVARRNNTQMLQSQNTQYDDLDIGQLVQVVEKTGGGYTVHYRGTQWQAKSEDDLQIGQAAKIVARESSVFIVQIQED